MKAVSVKTVAFYLSAKPSFISPHNQL